MDDRLTDPVVLLVDDDEIARFLHRQVLEPAGFEIVEAEDGAAALEAFAISLPDIVVLDLMMPEMDGFAVCQAIRATPAGRNIPILVATGLEDVESIERAFRIGATDFIAKPISCPVLPHRLRYMLRAYHLAESQRISGLGHFRWSPNKPRVECSPELSQMLGMTDATATHSAKSLLRRVFPADRPALIRAVREALQGVRIELDHRIVTSAGCVRTLLLRGEFLGDEGTPKYLHGSYQDITERKRVETHLAAARDKAQEASAAKTAFLGAMSHELLTPLNAIIGFTDLILQEAVGPISQPGYLEFARNIRTAGQRALAVFRDVLTMAELEADLFPLHLEEIELCALAGAVVREFRQTSAGSDRVIVVDATEKSAAVHADPRAVRQMLEKLLSNAAKFSPAGSAIAVAVGSAGGGSVRVSVADAGIGMTGEEITAAIRPFGQVADGLARPYEGLGLGLTIVSRLIALHRGCLTIASAPQDGTKISLDFPVPSPRGLSKTPADCKTVGKRAGCSGPDAFLTELGVAPG
jgi:signal transduction histidine kinase